MDSDSNKLPGMSLPQPSGGGLGAHTSTGVELTGPQVSPMSSVQAADSDAAATDEDLDLEWVSKAKDIVEQTKSDPFTLSNELNKAKAEYLRARFNKELNTGEKSSQ